MAHVIPTLRSAQSLHVATPIRRATAPIDRPQQFQLAPEPTSPPAAQQKPTPQPTSVPAAATVQAAAATVPAAAAAAPQPTQQTDLRALFSYTPPANAVTPPPAQPQQPVPTAESVFGVNPWMTGPTGTAPNGQTYSYNPYYFATPQTAAKVAQMVGGTVIQSNVFTPNSGGGFSQNQPNYMVQLSDGRVINPGLVASFYNHGYSQSYVDTMVAAEIRST